MLGFLEISNSPLFQRFIPDPWYDNEKRNRCDICGFQHVHQFAENVSDTHDEVVGYIT